MEFVEKIKQKAKSNLKTIVLPEAEEERNLKAADRILSEGFAKLILIGNPEKVHHLASELYLENIAGAEIVDPNDNPKKQQYVDLMLKLRASKGLTAEQAEKLIVNPLYLGALMVKAGDADGEVAGANNPTGDVLRPAFQYVKTLPGISVVSGAFIMMLPDTMFGENGMMVFADCAVHPNPTAEELAQIAVMTGRTTRAIAGFEPRIAMLSFSTKGSAKHEMVDKVVRATELAKQMDPSLAIEANCRPMRPSFRASGPARRRAARSPARRTCSSSLPSRWATSPTSSCSAWRMPRRSARSCREWPLRSTTFRADARSTTSCRW